MNPWHVLEAIETLKTWFLQIPRKVKLRLKAGLFGDPVLKLFFEKRCKNVPIVIIVSPAWKWLSSECRNCDVSTTYSSCLLMKWQCRRFAHPCPAGICLVGIRKSLSDLTYSPKSRIFLFKKIELCLHWFSFFLQICIDFPNKIFVRKIFKRKCCSENQCKSEENFRKTFCSENQYKQVRLFFREYLGAR